MRTKKLLLLLPLFAVCATPAFANYFANPKLGIQLNVGSAPNPKPAKLHEVFTYNETTTTYPAPPPAAMVAEVTPPLAPLPAPPAIHHFVVFFDFDKSSLTAEARDVVGAAVNAAKQSGLVRIVVTGHTDTVGSLSYNQGLSERRAESVKAEMLRLGMDNTDISTNGRSFTDPLIETGPGVREPQNRRAVIDLGDLPVAELN